MQRAADSADAGGALEQLCRACCYPLYAFARRSGMDEEDARDATQDFFALLVSGQLLEKVDARASGSGRSCLAS